MNNLFIKGNEKEAATYRIYVYGNKRKMCLLLRWSKGSFLEESEGLSGRRNQKNESKVRHNEYKGVEFAMGFNNDVR